MYQVRDIHTEVLIAKGPTFASIVPFVDAMTYVIRKDGKEISAKELKAINLT